MKKLTVIIAAAFVAALASASFAQYPNNGYIGVYGDAAATQCCVTIPPFTPTTLYVISHLSGGTAGGVTGAEFRIEVSPAPAGAYLFSWTASATLSVALGNPVDENPTDITNSAGSNLAFATCQPETPGTPVQWGTLSVIALTASPPALTLRVKQKTPVTNPNHTAPLFTLCDAPLFTAVDMTVTQDALGGEEPVAFVAFINNPGCAACGPVAVSPTTWSAVKDLFR